MSVPYYLIRGHDRLVLLTWFSNFMDRYEIRIKKGTLMSFNLGSIRDELDKVVGEATNLADFVDKYAAVAARVGSAIPTIGPDVRAAAAAIDELDRALHAVHSAV